MGRKKACFGREDYVCLTKDCPYMNECIQAVWERKVSGLLRRSRGEEAPKEERARTRARSRR